MNPDSNPHAMAPAEPAGGASAQHEKLEALARLGGGMAHDFNNILHVIKSATELLRRQLPNAGDDVARLLEMLTRNAERGTGLTRDILAFAARHTLQPAALNANRVIAEMQDRLRQALGRGPQIETALGGSLWQVHADPAELETAILNLAKNARDAMAGGGKVVIETANVVVDAAAAKHRGIAPGEYVAIAVRDGGSGMSTATRARAFDPYFTTKAPGPMTGLGLSRVYGFVKQMQGHIELDSAPGSGTTVTLYLPRFTEGAANALRTEPQAQTNVLSLTARPLRARGAGALAGLRVLVVEDESLIGMLAEDLLEQLGCRMAGLVSSLARALDMARTADIDLALLDVDIAGEPVYPVATALQARGVPFLFMSGYGGLEGPWQGRPIVQKPFDLVQLRSEIERALSGK
jgi:nitrogen-specific signal transduction histidine kinase/CheY-like chemotaxis protein